MLSPDGMRTRSVSRQANRRCRRHRAKPGAERSQSHPLRHFNAESPLKRVGDFLRYSRSVILQGKVLIIGKRLPSGNKSLQLRDFGLYCSRSVIRTVDFTDYEIRST